MLYHFVVWVRLYEAEGVGVVALGAALLHVSEEDVNGNIREEAADCVEDQCHDDATMIDGIGEGEHAGGKQ